MPKLTLRDLFFIVTLAAMLVAWWVDHRRLASDATLQREEASAIRALQAAGAQIEVDYQGHALVVTCELPTRRAFTDRDLAHVAALPHLRELWLEQTTVTDAGLRHLQHLEQLETLALICKGGYGRAVRITDVGIKHLSGLTNLRVLRLDNSRVSDRGLVSLSRLTKLHDLDLFGTEISDAGLVHLQGLKNLEYLNISETQRETPGRAVTVEAARALAKHLPRCDIDY